MWFKASFDTMLTVAVTGRHASTTINTEIVQRILIGKTTPESSTPQSFRHGSDHRLEDFKAYHFSSSRYLSCLALYATLAPRL